jgi:hypothetical protein
MLLLSRPYASRDGLPIIRQVDPRIYRQTYFAACLDCTFCHDGCCTHGARVDPVWLKRTAARADDLESFLGIPRAQWFQDWFEPDNDYAGGGFTRTALTQDRCIFLNREGRGCLLHRFALDRGLDPREVKPMVCCLFPVLWENGVLNPALEVLEESLVCLGPGETLYRSARANLAYFFGDDFVAELDTLEATVLAVTDAAAPRTIRLPLVPD